MESETSYLDNEHTELLEGMQNLSACDTEVGHAFKDIARVFSYHLDREESTVIPLLKYLRRKAEGECESSRERLLAASENFHVEYDSMLKEHGEIEKLLGSVESIGVGMERSVSDLIHDLRHHVEIEEEILYPAALAAGNLFMMEKDSIIQKSQSKRD
ncbi:MAG: hemerythrin domain-containing protein [Candidatus Thermoplasmatota archaeon]|jgi:iron-sulfur cluster repair protein YtfE (RIC family)|nr:hemerythrin domain-containing protein [Candidatus Thermoplasmatota archaeon]